MQRSTQSDKFPIGTALPTFSLKNIDGSKITESYFHGAKASLVAFMCNHCPYVKGSEQALIEIVKKYRNDGLRAVTINSNDAAQYPEDGFEQMQEKAERMALPYPYLYDETQRVAKQFDAACTPELYLFNEQLQLAYHGTINDNPKDSSKATKDFLSSAIEQVLKHQKADPSFVHPIGCSIKWRR